MRRAAYLLLALALASCHLLSCGSHSDGSTSSSATAGPSSDAPDSAAKQTDECNYGSPRTGTFDPKCVYAFGGQVAEFDVFAPNAPDNLAAVRSLSNWDEPLIRPSDGRLVFDTLDTKSNVTELWVFTNSTSPPSKLPSPTCPGSSAFTPLGFFPDDSKLLYFCPDNSYRITDEDGFVELGGYPPLALAADRVILAGTGTPDLALVQRGAITPISGFDETSTVFTARSRSPSGFRFATMLADGATRVLVEVDATGQATKLGAYDLGTFTIPQPPRCALEITGALICTHILDDTNDFGIVRFKIDGSPELLYDQRTGPVMFYGHIPVTGP